MKKRASLSNKQLLLALGFFLVFTGLTVFLFTYKRDEKKFSHITSRLFTEEMTSSTLNMHYTLAYPANFGIYRYEPLLPTYSNADTLKNQAAAENTLASLHTIRPEKLSPGDSYTHRLLLRALENTLHAGSFSYYDEPLSPASGMQSQLPILLAEYTFRTEQDITDYLALLDQIDEYFNSLLVFEQEKADAGLLMSAASMEKVVKQCDTIVTKEALSAGTHFLQTTFEERLLPLRQNKTITEKDAAFYLAENDRLLQTVVLPAYVSLGDGLFLLEDKSIPLEGLAAKPQGRDYYEQLLIAQTGSYRGISDIRQLLTAKFTVEFEAIQRISAENPTLLQRMATEDYTAFPYTDADQMLLDLQKRMKEDFPRLPDEASLPTVTVKAVSPSLESYTAPAFYLTAPLDDTDNNVIYINEKNSPTGLELYTTLAHEGYPGHLYQTVYSNQTFMNQNENKARHLLWYGGYQEGWALYVEFISYDYATQLLSEQERSLDAAGAQLEKHNRSLQLCLYSLLDIMIHYENAPFSQVAKMLESFGIANTDSVKAIYTYIAEEPCNYLKYYLGYLEILSLKQEAQKLWGEQYSDLAFHRFFLDSGPSDFTSLRERMLETPPQTVLLP